MVYLWRLFNRIRSRKGSSGFGRSPIEWPDLDAFQRLSGITLRPFELEMIEMLDDLCLADHSKPETD